MAVVVAVERKMAKKKKDFVPFGCAKENCGEGLIPPKTGQNEAEQAKVDSLVQRVRIWRKNQHLRTRIWIFVMFVVISDLPGVCR